VYHDVGQGAVPSVEIPLVHLPRMETFIILHLCKDDATAAQLDYLMVSALRNVKISGSFYSFVSDRFISLLHRSSCRVQQLHLGDVIVAEDQLIQCLEHMPTLVDLEIRLDPVTDNPIHPG
jgi:hypothetical protein